MRTLYQTGKLAQTVEEMHKYQLKMLAVQETRWTGSGKRYLATGDTIIWSGRSDNNHPQGVALMLDKEASRALLEWNPVNERVLYVRLNSKFTNFPLLWFTRLPKMPKKNLKKSSVTVFKQLWKRSQNTTCSSS